jgi:hypothetical protein
VRTILVHLNVADPPDGVTANQVASAVECLLAGEVDETIAGCGEITVALAEEVEV